ncbi:MFS transporter [Pyxidicoccus sp. MSG2]|uniref:MFS transporter n=1 Tax=Pyxidicoccus sp. MSG2 TaxID=2996790 RepID=UPI002270A963|nr:MFS transporter [Pyxidicoccus sp. MSG2]MCY1023991.1 MFS transporter [Pyxidicoccus sp. MSG2]
MRVALTLPRLPQLDSGWRLAWTFALTETVSYGVLHYAFSVFMVPMETELGWSRAATAGSFSLGLLVSGLAAPWAGAWVDRHGPRALMTVGSTLGAALVLAWAHVQTLPALYLIWLGLGLARAAVLYEPAFATLSRLSAPRRARAIALVTGVAGFASTIFLPLATWLVASLGWRAALLLLAAILAVGTAAPHALWLGDSSRSVLHASEELAGRAPASSSPTHNASVRWLALAFALSSLVASAVHAHLVSWLLQRGHSATFAAAAAGGLGAAAVAGRLVLLALSNGVAPLSLMRALCVAQTLALGCLLLSGSTGAWAFVALFGAATGTLTPTRALLVAEMFPAASVGRRAGQVGRIATLGQALGPWGVGLLSAWGLGEEGMLLLLAALCLLAAAAVRGESSVDASPPASETRSVS